MFLRKMLMISTAAVLLLGIAGCEAFSDAWKDAMNPETSKSSWGEEYKPKFVMTLFQIVDYPRAGDLEAEISTFDGKKVWINTNQFFSSKNIKDIKLLPRADQPDTYDLALQLDERGVRMWTIMAIDFRDKKVAMMIDKYYEGSFSPQPLASEDATWVVIKYPFNQVTAAGLQKFAKKNYEFFNPSPTSFF